MKNYLKGFLRRYELEAIVLVLLVFLWKFRGLFSMFGNATDTAAAALAGATAKVQQAAETAQAKAKLTVAAPHATEAQIAVFKQDAQTLASDMGRLPGVWSNWLLPNADDVLQLVKKYSRVMFANGKPVKSTKEKGGYALRKSEYRLTSLAPFYKDVTLGRDLFSDLDAAIKTLSKEKYTLYITYLK